MEELDAEIEITGLQPPIEHSYNHAKARLWPYECKLTKHSPEPQALKMKHSELAWVECWVMWQAVCCLLIGFSFSIYQYQC
jgi:hypothetical protein